MNKTLAAILAAGATFLGGNAQAQNGNLIQNNDFSWGAGQASCQTNFTGGSMTSNGNASQTKYSNATGWKFDDKNKISLETDVEQTKINQNNVTNGIDSGKTDVTIDNILLGLNYIGAFNEDWDLTAKALIPFYKRAAVIDYDKILNINQEDNAPGGFGFGAEATLKNSIRAWLNYTKAQGRSRTTTTLNLPAPLAKRVSQQEMDYSKDTVAFGAEGKIYGVVLRGDLALNTEKKGNVGESHSTDFTGVISWPYQLVEVNGFRAGVEPYFKVTTTPNWSEVQNNSSSKATTISGGLKIYEANNGSAR